MPELRKIITKEELEKKQRRNFIIIGVVLVLLMLISPAGYTFFSENSGTVSNDKIKYNGINFIKNENGYWQFTKNEKNYFVKYNPLELNNTKSSTNLYLSKFENQIAYFEWNISQEGVSEIVRNINFKRYQRACLSDINCTFDVPTVDCSEVNAIAFREPKLNESERIYKDKNCVFIISKDINTGKFADAFLFEIIGI